MGRLLEDLERQIDRAQMEAQQKKLRQAEEAARQQAKQQ